LRLESNYNNSACDDEFIIGYLLIFNHFKKISKKQSVVDLYTHVLRVVYKVSNSGLSLGEKLRYWSVTRSLD